MVDGTNDVIFEAGGDGTGVALVVIGSDLTVYQDRGDYLAASPADDSMFSVDISEFLGSVISIRLDADLSTPIDILTVTATDGSSTVTNAFTLPGDVVNIAGGNDTGFGMTADLAGLTKTQVCFNSMELLLKELVQISWEQAHLLETFMLTKLLQLLSLRPAAGD